MKKLFSLILLICILFSCKKNDLISSSDAQLSISTDSLKFDTVFSTVGSITKSFKIINENDQRIRLSSIKLMGGDQSPYHININGTASSEVQQVEIAAEDSIYIFVTVFVDPNAAALPFILSDSIRIAYNNNERYVQLEAFGQNAIFLRNAEISSNQTWTAQLPYVILEGIKILPGVTLEMQPGTRIFSHANAPFLIEGSLKALGTKSSPIVFNGDRLDEPYRNFPASWPGMYFMQTSFDNILVFTQIQNAYQAVVVTEPSNNANPKLIIQQSIIDNAYDVGLLCHNTRVSMNNSLIRNSSRNLHIQLGGMYDFTNCSFASYSNEYLLHKTPVTSVRNFAAQGGTVYYNDLEATFSNCIFWGSESIVPNEIEVLKEGASIFDVQLHHCIYKAQTDPSFTTLTNCLANIDPMFDSIDVQNNIFDFHNNHPSAPGVDNGISTIFAVDLDNHNRAVSNTDIGCYEKQ